MGETSTRRKVTITGILAGLASVATILGVLASSGHSSSSSSTPAAYPAQVQANYLSACEAQANASVAGCQCTLSWFEANVSLAQFAADDQAAQAGQEPADLAAAVAACG